jgi:putative ABC transport system ATP-binding protein
LIVLRQVAKSFSEGKSAQRVLDGLDLTIGRGELVVLLGRSGSGKSTLLNLVAGIELADRGEVLFDGVDLGKLDERGRTLLRREKIGFVFQFFNLIPTLTVEENVLFPLELLGRHAAADRAGAAALLDYVGLAGRKASFPDALSGGEQQRVALARALVSRPALLLADEPTGNLDGDNAAQVLRLLVSAVREQGATLLMATHSREVALLADRVVEMVHGRLATV